MKVAGGDDDHEVGEVMLGPEFFEMLMMISFGFAWPASIVKSFKSKTAKGKSLLFMVVIGSGYLFGIASKFAENSITYVLVFYCINVCMVSLDIVLYCINKQRDKRRESAEQCL